MVTEMTTEPDIAQSRSGSSGSSSRMRLHVAAIALVLVAALGALGAVLLAGGEADESGVIRADGGDLTARQEEMVAMVDDYVSGWQATDGDRAASYMTADGYVEYVRQDWAFYVADGSLQNRINNDAYRSLRRTGPTIVYDDRVVFFGSVNTGVLVKWVSVIQFTAAGDVKIMSEVIDPW